MSPARRTERYEAEHTTTQAYRTNLRRIREMLGLTRDEATARIEPPKLTSAMLARIETGERGLSVEELVQLAVAYQVPPATILIPWSQEDIAKPPALSGADYKLPLEGAQNWTLSYEYPPYPSAITRFGSAIQGAINARLYANPATLLALSNDPTPDNYIARTTKELDAFLEPLTQAIDNFYTEVADFCRFDPRPHFEGFEESEQNGSWPASLDPLLLKAITEDPTTALAKLEEKRAKVAELKHAYLSGYGKDAVYSTIGPLRNFPETVEQRCAALIYYPKISTAITYAYNQQTKTR